MKTTLMFPGLLTLRLSSKLITCGRNLLHFTHEGAEFSHIFRETKTKDPHIKSCEVCRYITFQTSLLWAPIDLLKSGPAALKTLHLRPGGNKTFRLRQLFISITIDLGLTKIPNPPPPPGLTKLWRHMSQRQVRPRPSSALPWTRPLPFP